MCQTLHSLEKGAKAWNTEQLDFFWDVYFKEKYLNFFGKALFLDCNHMILSCITTLVCLEGKTVTTVFEIAVYYVCSWIRYSCMHTLYLEKFFSAPSSGACDSPASPNEYLPINFHSKNFASGQIDASQLGLYLGAKPSLQWPVIEQGQQNLAHTTWPLYKRLLNI